MLPLNGEGHMLSLELAHQPMFSGHVIKYLDMIVSDVLFRCHFQVFVGPMMVVLLVSEQKFLIGPHLANLLIFGQRML